MTSPYPPHGDPNGQQPGPYPSQGDPYAAQPGPYQSQGDPYAQPQQGQYPAQGGQYAHPDPSAAGSSYELAGPSTAGGYTDPYAQPNPHAQPDPYSQQVDPYTQAYQPQPVYQALPVAVPAPAYSMAGGYQVDPMTGRPLSDKSKLTAGLLQIFLGGFGVGRFYTGHIGMAIGQIAVTVTLGCLGVFLIVPWCGMGLWGLIDGIVLLSSSTATDSEGRLLRK